MNKETQKFVGMKIILAITISLMIFCVCGISYVIYHEIKCPCLERGESKILYYQNIGNIIIPIEDVPCIKRDTCNK